jgi:hypothetical protein
MRDLSRSRAAKGITAVVALVVPFVFLLPTQDGSEQPLRQDTPRTLDDGADVDARAEHVQLLLGSSSRSNRSRL